MAKRTDEIDWRAYDAALKHRGSLTFWFSDETVEAWNATKTGPHAAISSTAASSRSWISHGLIATSTPRRPALGCEPQRNGEWR
jgi:hypothetical protein